MPNPNLFPAQLCTRTNKQEPDVNDSDQLFLCILWGKRFPGQLRVMQLYPYTVIDCDSQDDLLCGWVDKDGNPYDHQERSVHSDDEMVIAWEPLSKEIEDLRDLSRYANCPWGTT